MVYVTIILEPKTWESFVFSSIYTHSVVMGRGIVDEKLRLYWCFLKVSHAEKLFSELSQKKEWQHYSIAIGSPTLYNTQRIIQLTLHLHNEWIDNCSLWVHAYQSKSQCGLQLHTSEVICFLFLHNCCAKPILSWGMQTATRERWSKTENECEGEKPSRENSDIIFSLVKMTHSVSIPPFIKQSPS